MDTTSELRVSETRFCFYPPFTKSHYDEMMKVKHIRNQRIVSIEIDFKEPTTVKHRFSGIQKVIWGEPKIVIMSLRTLQTGKDHRLALVTRNLIELAADQILAITIYYAPDYSVFESFDQSCNIQAPQIP